MDGATVREYYRDPVAVQHYTDAAARLGLWASEEIVLSQVFKRDQTLLDCGCGAGRITFGLWELGYRHLLGFDFSREMIQQARRMARLLDYGTSFRVADATRLILEPGAFDGAVFGFNGLMQIPLRSNRRKAMAGIAASVRLGGFFVFTTHDRDLKSYGDLWAEERRIWKEGQQSSSLLEFGDRHFASPEGTVFMHVPDQTEICEDLAATGFELAETHLRSELASESTEVRDFSDECRFWIARRV